MNRIVAGYPQTVGRQNPVTKLDFLRTKIVIKLLMMGAFIVALALFYIWSRIQIVQIGYEINEFKREQQILLDENKKYQMELSLMKSPKRLKLYASERLHMSFPDRDRMIEVK